MEREERGLLLPVNGSASGHHRASGEEGEVGGLGRATALSREEVLRLRVKRLRRLEAVYRRQYWVLMEEIRAKHREYCWEHGKSPLEEEEEEEKGGEGEEGGGGLGLETGDRKRCPYAGCKAKAMPLTTFCHQHILSDRNQTLYKQCHYVIRSTQQTGQIICGKPVLKAATTSLCPIHLQKTQKGIILSLKKAGLNASSNNKTLPIFNSMIVESVRQIQSKRRGNIAWKAEMQKLGKRI
ncbi:hypothetical protein LUZ60_009689 [Juncus effusus]|nr:hypothetical protein LUZ60_009689 [Juncus effusus]